MVLVASAKRNINTILIPLKLIKLSATASTNDYLLEQLRQHSPSESHLVYTLDQTAGRGQQGNSWYGRSGESLAMSLFWPFTEESGIYLSALNWLVSLAVIDTLSAQIDAPLRLKWPNDIMAGDRKLAGLLIESQLRGSSVRSTVIGLGINVNNLEFPDSLRAVSLRQLDGSTRDADALCLEIGASLYSALDSFPETDVSRLQEQYLQAQYGLGEWLEFESQGRRFQAQISGIEKSGALELIERDQSLTTYYPKEIKYCF